MLSQSLSRNIILVYSLIIILTLTGAKQLAPEKPPWDGDIALDPCERIANPIMGVLHGGGVSTYTIDLKPGDYTVAGWASWDLVSLCITVDDAQGIELVRDDGLDNTPVVEFALETAGSIKINLIAGAARVDGIPGQVSLVVARGTDCYESDSPLTKYLLDAWTLVVSDEDAEVKHWLVDVISGSKSGMYSFELSGGSYTVVTETTNSHDDIDMYVRLGDDTVISKDELPNNFPICHFELTTEMNVTIEVDPWEYGEGSTTGLVLLVARNAESN